MIFWSSFASRVASRGNNPHLFLGLMAISGQSCESELCGTNATMNSKSKFTPPSDSARQAEAAKTSRLRALRLAKEAEDKETAAREAAVAAAQPKRRRARTAAAAET